MSGSKVEIKELRKQFDKKVVLKDVSFDCQEGESVIILGESGMGKSVMMRIIGMLLNATSGSVKIDGQEIVGITDKNKEKVNWPKASYFSVFDGHGGNKCAEFLRDNLLKLICDNDYFPNDIEKAIKYGFSEADKIFLENAAKDGELIDNSGSCGLLLLIIDNKIYIANVGDSRCIISMKSITNYTFGGLYEK